MIEVENKTFPVISELNSKEVLYSKKMFVR